MATNTIDELLVGLGLSVDKQSFQQAGSSLNQLREAGLRVAAVFGAGLGFKAMTTDAAEMNNKLTNISQRLGVSASAVDAFGFAWRRAGGEAGEAMSALSSAQSFLDRLQKGDSEAFNMAAIWGLDANGLAEAKNSVQFMLRLYDQLQNRSKQEQRQILEAFNMPSDAAFQIMTGARGNLRQTLQQGNNMRPMSEDLLEESRKYVEATANFQQATMGVVDLITEEALPQITGALNFFSKFLTQNRKDIAGFVSPDIESTGEATTKFGKWIQNKITEALPDAVRKYDFKGLDFSSSSPESSTDTAQIKDAAQKALARDSALKNGISDALIDSVLQQESGGRHRDAQGNLTRNARSGALGAYQIMPGTGRDPGYGVKPLQNNSEEEHRRFAGDYLGAMYQEFDGNMAQALAAYNAGPGNVRNAMRERGASWLSGMAPETQNYVPSVLNRAGSGGGTVVNHNEFNFTGSPEENAREVQRAMREMADQTQQDYTNPLR